MNKEELKQEAEQDAGNASGFDLSTSLMVTKNKTDAYRLGRFDGYLSGAEPREKRISELEEKISVLLSCKNCPENKGGFICVKEYENKCLAQKIQYIKELKEENKVLAQNLEDTEILNKTYEKRFNDLEKENAELKDDNKVMADNYSKMEQKFYDNLTKAKDILRRLMENQPTPSSMYEEADLVGWREVNKEAEQFLKDCEVEK